MSVGRKPDPAVVAATTDYHCRHWYEDVTQTPPQVCDLHVIATGTVPTTRRQDDTDYAAVRAWTSNSKHWFTTSFLWRKVPESDARSVHGPIGRFSEAGLLE